MKVIKQLLLFNMLSVVFLFMFCSNNLYPQTESSGGLMMPFYGTVGEVIYAGKPACNNCRVSLIVDEQATLFLHCQNWTCAPYPLFCTCGAANVSKTVLTQCNTIIAFQAFDETSFNFLGNYIGKDFVQALPNLPQYHAIVTGKAVKANIPMIIDLTRE